MTAFLIARLPSHPKSLEAVEYMQRNDFSYRISTNVPVVNILMSSEGGESRQPGIFEELKLGKEEVHVIDNFTCIFSSNNKVEVNSRENSPPNENPASIECIVLEEDDVSEANQSDDQNHRMEEIIPEAVQFVEFMEIPIVPSEQAEEVGDDHQEEEMNCSLDQVEKDDVEDDDVLIADDHEFDENISEILMPVAEQGVLEPSFEEEEELEESNVLDENEGEEEEHEIAVDELLGPLDEDDSTVALRPSRNNDVLFDFEDSLNDELQEENEINDSKDGDEEDMGEFEEEEELVEEQEHEEDAEKQTDEDIDDDGLEVEEKDSDEEVNDNDAAGDPIVRLLFTCFFKSCPSSFNTFKELEDHVKVHTGKQEFFCDVCRKKFSSKPAAMRHIRLRAKSECCACGLKTLSACKLVVHHRCHTAERPYGCTTCGKRFTQLSALKTHMLTHTGEKRFSCDICKKSFALKQNLETHKRSHTGEKPFSCGHCEKRFSQGQHLKAHELTHSGEKRFECKDCGRKFSRRAYMNRHLGINTGEKPFACKKCDAKLASKPCLKYHVKKNHK